MAALPFKMSLSWVVFDTELELSLFMAFQNQVFELYHLAALPPKMRKFLPIAMAQKYMVL